MFAVVATGLGAGVVPAGQCGAAGLAAFELQHGSVCRAGWGSLRNLAQLLVGRRGRGNNDAGATGAHFRGLPAKTRLLICDFAVVGVLATGLVTKVLPAVERLAADCAALPRFLLLRAALQPVSCLSTRTLPLRAKLRAGLTLAWMAREPARVCALGVF